MAFWEWIAAIVVLTNAVTAGVAIYFWRFRNAYRPLTNGRQLSEDMRERERQALEINDNVVQSLTVAKLALEMGEAQQASEALDSSLISARSIITDLLGEEPPTSAPAPGKFRRERAATMPAPLG